MYMPVEVDTEGGTPSEIISGLKIAPPPRPSAPPTHPPRNAKVSNSFSCLPLYLISLGIRPLFNFYFKACSFMFILRPAKLNSSITITKRVNIVQSTKPHFSIGKSFTLFVPLISVTARLVATAPKANRCLGHYFEWEFSASSIALSALRSYSVASTGIEVIFLTSSGYNRGATSCYFCKLIVRIFTTLSRRRSSSPS